MCSTSKWMKAIRTSWSRSVASLEPTFGGINLEDIKAPECFYIERALRERMKIPVFHDDQHGAIIAARPSSMASSWSARTSAT